MQLPKTEVPFDQLTEVFDVWLVTPYHTELAPHSGLDLTCACLSCDAGGMAALFEGVRCQGHQLVTASGPSPLGAGTGSASGEGRGDRDDT